MPDDNPLIAGRIAPDNKSGGADGKTVLVTGVTGGLGGALATRLNELGVNVILSGRNLSRLENLYDRLDAVGNAEPALYPIDLAGAQANDYQDLADVLNEQYGQLDAIAHCAAELGQSTPLEVYPPDVWTRVMRVNCHAAFMLSTACLPLLKSSGLGSIVFTIDRKQSAFWGAYGCSKAAVLNLAEIMADETEGLCDEPGIPRVAVNAVHPGRMRTRLRAAAYSGERPEQSPYPETRVEAYLKVLLRDDPTLTGQLIHLAPEDLPE